MTAAVDGHFENGAMIVSFAPPVMTPSPRLATDTYEAIRDTAFRFADERVRPIAGTLDAEESFPRELYREMGKLGLFGLTVPEADGGAGLDTFAYALVMEELSRGYASVADQCGLVELIGTLLTAHGTPAQKARWLPGVLAAETLVAYCITEAEAGTDVSGIKTTAIRDGDGWRLSGSKLWIHNAPVADVGFLLARTDPGPAIAACRSSSSTSRRQGSAVAPRSTRWGNGRARSAHSPFDNVRLGPRRCWGRRTAASTS